MQSDAIGRPMEILFVEDSLTQGTLTLGALKKVPFQYRCTWLSDGEQARQFLSRGGPYGHAPKPDLVLLDLGLPKVDGLTVLRELKSRPGMSEIPVVIMTASMDPAERQQAEDLAVVGYLLKPLDLSAFLRLIQDLKDFWQADLWENVSQSDARIAT